MVLLFARIPWVNFLIASGENFGGEPDQDGFLHILNY